jgi:hypothetical protein
MVNAAVEVTSDKLLAKQRAIEVEIASTSTTNDPAEFVARADSLLGQYDAGAMARDAQISALRARRDEVAATYRVREQERQAAEVGQREAERQALCDELVAEKEGLLQDVDTMERGQVLTIAAKASAEVRLTRMRAIAASLARGQKLPRGYDLVEFTNRQAGRTSALWAKCTRALRWGWITWTGGSIFTNRESAWAEQERVIFDRAVAESIEHGGRQ